VAVLPRAALNGAQELPISYLTLITSVRNWRVAPLLAIFQSGPAH
jgi:hypothetical protein